MASEAKLTRKLKGHSRSLLCCHAPLVHSDLVATSGQDGKVCLFDLRERNNVQHYECFGGEAVSSICFTPTRSDILYASAGSSVYCVDMRSGSVGEATMKFNYNSEEINQVAVNQKANYLAAADDSGDIKVIDLEKCRLQRTLRGVHTNICSSVQFHPHRPWELISGGLDSKIVKWDFNKGRPLKILDQGVGAAQPGPCGQLFNPPFVHALAIPEGKVSGKTSRVLAVARGNGAVEISDVTLEKCHTLRSCNYPSQDLRNLGESTQLETCHREEDAMEGMHLSAVSTITLARFNGSKAYVISGGNDRCIKLWNWCNESEISTNPEGSSINSPIGQLLLDVPHTRKVNWICTAARSSEHIFVADTSKSLTVLTVT